MQQAAPNSAHLFVIFGVTGDLAERKLLPAFYHVTHREGCEGMSYLLGVGRRDWSDDEFRRRAKQTLTSSGLGPGELSSWCDEQVFFHGIDDYRSQESFVELRSRINQIEHDCALPQNRIYYLALPPDAFPAAVTALGENGLAHSAGYTRLVIEKPFGKDLETARRLDQVIHRYFGEDQVYRIDHYLGKTTVQNMLVFRFANGMFEPLWNRDRISRVELTVGEDLGVGTRGGYYDTAGALRDMVQNHILQLISLVAMEPPTAFEAESIRSEKVKVVRSITALRDEDVVLGQYGAGEINGQPVTGYLEEPKVAAESQTETYAALRLHVDTWRWHGIPFYVRTGKRLPRRTTKIAIVFREAPLPLFRAFQVRPPANVLVISIQPDEGFDLFFEVKTPDRSFRLDTKRLTFRYQDHFGRIPEAYETLIADVVGGDQTLFVHTEEVEASWRLLTPLLQHKPPVSEYRAGSWGPDEIYTLLPDWVDYCLAEPTQTVQRGKTVPGRENDRIT